MTFRARTAPMAAAACVALLAAGLAAFLTRQGPRGGTERLLTGPETWLVAVFVAAVLLLLFGASAWLGVAFRGRGAREALEALRARADEMDGGRSDMGGGGEGGLGWAVDGGPGPEAGMSPAWIVEVGGWLALLYVAGWIVLG